MQCNKTTCIRYNTSYTDNCELKAAEECMTQGHREYVSIEEFEKMRNRK